MQQLQLLSPTKLSNHNIWKLLLLRWTKGWCINACLKRVEPLIFRIITVQFDKPFNLHTNTPIRLMWHKFRPRSCHTVKKNKINKSVEINMMINPWILPTKIYRNKVRKVIRLEVLVHHKLQIIKCRKWPTKIRMKHRLFKLVTNQIKILLVLTKNHPWTP